MSNCTIETLLHACQLTYRVKSKHQFNKDIDASSKLKSIDAIDKNKYQLVDSIQPQKEGGEGDTNLTAIALKSFIEKEPIIIAFRGTKTVEDIKSNYNIMKKGLADHNQLTSAWKFYQKIKRENPGREIILTGHSLGGHIATFVGLMAYHFEGITELGISIRTFNTAPFLFKNREFFKLDNTQEAAFINYRLSNDAISSIPFFSYFGNIFSFKTRSKGKIDSHMLWAMHEDLPEDVKKIKVSSNPYDNFLENLLGQISCYECRVSNQFFSSMRIGIKNLSILKNLYKNIETTLDSSDLVATKELITIAQKKIRGKNAIALLNRLEQQIDYISGTELKDIIINHSSSSLGA